MDRSSKAILRNVPKTLAKRPQRQPVPARTIQLARVGSGEIPDYVTLPEIKDARDAANDQGRTLIGLLWSTGCRISEALDLQVAHLDSRQQTAQLATLKRKVETSRVVPVPGVYFAELLAWCHAQRRYGSERVFSWRRSMASRIVTAALVAAGVERKRAHPHAIRHGHAVHALNNDIPLNHIQRMLGHADLLTTSIYLRVTAKDIRDAHKGVEW